MTMVGASSGVGADHAVFEIGVADAEEAGGGERSCHCSYHVVMPGLVPGIHVFRATHQDGDGRVKPAVTSNCRA